MSPFSPLAWPAGKQQRLSTRGTRYGKSLKELKSPIDLSGEREGCRLSVLLAQGQTKTFPNAVILDAWTTTSSPNSPHVNRRSWRRRGCLSSLPKTEPKETPWRRHFFGQGGRVIHFPTNPGHAGFSSSESWGFSQPCCQVLPSSASAGGRKRTTRSSAMHC